MFIFLANSPAPSSTAFKAANKSNTELWSKLVNDNASFKLLPIILVKAAIGLNPSSPILAAS